MKTTAKIKWLIDEPQLNIHVDKTECINVDMDYVINDVEDITEYIENELAEKYGIGFYVGQDDFIIENMDDLLEDSDYEEFLDKTSC